MKPNKGVYISRHGKLKVFYISESGHWEVDEGSKISRKLFGFRITTPVVHSMTPGFPIFESFGPLYKCEFLGEL